MALLHVSKPEVNYCCSGITPVTKSPSTAYPQPFNPLSCHVVLISTGIHSLVATIMQISISNMATILQIIFESLAQVGMSSSDPKFQSIGQMVIGEKMFTDDDASFVYFPTWPLTAIFYFQTTCLEHTWNYMLWPSNPLCFEPQAL